ncbi:MAG: hypothetical protein J1E97_07295 [Muribaculaceae bacterium]|nr:hypothetical protein [Muribaculaceae bacterium]
MKEVIISTEAVNSYGSRVLTSGIDLSQYERNPVLLWMHRRSWEPDAMPIGRIENLRVEDGKLIGTPVFDQADEFAKKIESKWENGFLRMASAGLEPTETTADPSLILPGQTRETVVKSKLIEVSIVDIGGNDEALQLYGEEGKLLKLSAGEECPGLPLLQLQNENDPNPDEQEEGEEQNNKPKQQKMNKAQLELLGLPETATDEQATAALTLMKQRADNAATMELAAVTQVVDQAVNEKKILADQRDHFIKLGKSAGLQMLSETLATMQPQQKPTEVINLGKESAPGAGGAPQTYTKLSEVPADKVMELRKSNPAEYMKLYKAEYGVECPELKD